MLSFTKRRALKTHPAATASMLCFVTMLAIQQPAVRGQTGASKLTTVLGDLARSVPQDRGGGLFGALRPSLAMATLPRSVQDAASSQRLRVDANAAVQVYILLTEVTDDSVRQLRSAGARIEFIDAAG